MQIWSMRVRKIPQQPVVLQSVSLNKVSRFKTKEQSSQDKINCAKRFFIPLRLKLSNLKHFFSLLLFEILLNAIEFIIRIRAIFL